MKKIKENEPIKLYICEPLKSTTEELTAARDAALKLFRASLNLSDTDIVEVVNPVITDYPKDTVFPGLYILGQSITCMKDASMVLALNGWDSHNNCKFELAAAKAYQIPIFEIEQIPMYTNKYTSAASIKDLKVNFTIKRENN